MRSYINFLVYFGDDMWFNTVKFVIPRVLLPSWRSMPGVVAHRVAVGFLGAT